MLSANQFSGFLNFNISKRIRVIKLFFLHAGSYLLKVQIDVWFWVDVVRHTQKGY